MGGPAGFTASTPTTDPTTPLGASTMGEYPLLLSQVLEYGRSVHGNTGIRTYYGDNPEDSTFSQVGARATALAHALNDLAGVRVGDRVAPLMPNINEHLD